jgi:hypothetical protein
MVEHMNHDQLVRLVILGAIANLPATEQENVHAAAVRIRTVLADYPDSAGAMALALVGAEVTAE